MENDPADQLSRRVSELTEVVDSLRSTLHCVLLATFVGTAGIGGYLFQNFRTLSREAESEKGLIVKLQEEDRQMSIAANRLKDFAARTPDYAPILKKYGLNPELLQPAAAAPKK